MAIAFTPLNRDHRNKLAQTVIGQKRTLSLFCIYVSNVNVGVNVSKYEYNLLVKYVEIEYPD